MGGPSIHLVQALRKYLAMLAAASKRQLSIRRKKGFTFIEVVLTSILLGLFVFTVQTNLTRLFDIRNNSSSYSLSSS